MNSLLKVGFDVLFSAAALLSFSSFEPKTNVTVLSFASLAIFDTASCFAFKF